MTKNKKKGLVIGIVLAMLVLLGGLTGFFLYRAADPYDNRIVDNISIAGVDVGGMTKSEARKALNAAAEHVKGAKGLWIVTYGAHSDCRRVTLHNETQLDARRIANDRGKILRLHFILYSRRNSLPRNATVVVMNDLRYVMYFKIFVSHFCHSCQTHKFKRLRKQSAKLL